MGKMVTRIIIFITLFVSSGNLYSSDQFKNRLDLLNKLDMLDYLDFKDEIDAANECTESRDFNCAREKIAEASKLVQTEDDKADLYLAKAILDDEIELVRQEEIARQEELRRQREAEARRLAELRRQQEDAERRQREEEEKSNAMWLGFAARMVGTGLAASAADTTLDTQAWADIAVGAMEDSMNGGADMSSTTAAVNKTAQRFRQERMQAYGNRSNNTGTFGNNANSTNQKTQNQASATRSAKAHYADKIRRSNLKICNHPNPQANVHCKAANHYYERYVNAVTQGISSGEDIYRMHRNSVIQFRKFMNDFKKTGTVLDLSDSDSGECIMPQGHAANYSENWERYNKCRYEHDKSNRNNNGPSIKTPEVVICDGYNNHPLCRGKGRAGRSGAIAE